MTISDDLQLYVKTFGKALIFTLADGSTLNKNSKGQPIRGIFDNAYFLQEIGDMDLDNTQPRITCVEADVAKVKKEDTVRIDEILYDITGKPQPDGTGMCVIPLCLHGKM